MDILRAILLGVVQGLTEFLPVSSSGHIELGKALFGEEGAETPLLFTILVHGATALSTVVVFRHTIVSILRGAFRSVRDENFQYLLKIGVSMVPVGLIGVLLESRIEALFQGRLVLVGSMLLITALLLHLTTRVRHHQKGIDYLRATIIGLAQAIAILPGISRSGATISTALLMGVKRDKAARFSFLMVLPPILGASLLKTVEFAEGQGGSGNMGATALVLGFLAAFIAGLIACKWMVRIVERARLAHFTWYCGIVGMIAIGWGWATS